jgi:hypothetical protein
LAADLTEPNPGPTAVVIPMVRTPIPIGPFALCVAANSSDLEPAKHYHGQAFPAAFGELKVSYDVIGKMGRVTADITPGHLGEVLIEVRQGTERFLASSADPEATIKKHTQVLVVGSLGGRTVEVAPTDAVRLPR